MKHHYTIWRILYTIYWSVDAYWWPFGEHFPRFDNWLQDRMDSLGFKMGFLIPEYKERTP